MFIKTLVVGNLESNCVIVADEASKEAMIVDPGDEPDRIMDVVKENNLKVVYLVCTHGHFDHVGAVSDLKEETSAKVVMHRDELETYRAATDMAAFWGFRFNVKSTFQWPFTHAHGVAASWGTERHSLPYPDLLVNDADTLKLGRLSFTVFHTPGHS